MRFLYVIFIYFFLAGCSQDPPKCSDDATLSMVRSIIINKLIKLDGLTDKEVADNLKFEYSRAKSSNKDIKKVTCESKLIAGNSYEVTIEYESQLDDSNHHIVAASLSSSEDVWKIKSAIEESLIKSRVGNNILDKNKSQLKFASIQDFLAHTYDGYLPEKKCWIAEDDENSQKYCMKIDRVDTVDVVGSTRLYALLTGTAIDDLGDENGAHVTPGLIGAFVLEKHEGELKLIASDNAIPMGGYGNAPEEWELVKIGIDYYGWRNSSKDGHHGVYGSFLHILAPHESEIRDLVGFVNAFDDSGACVEEPCNTTSLQANFAFDLLKKNESVFPLVVEVSGQSEGEVISPRKYVISFDFKKWNFPIPENYILSNREF